MCLLVAGLETKQVSHELFDKNSKGLQEHQHRTIPYAFDAAAKSVKITPKPYPPRLLVMNWERAELARSEAQAW